MDEVLMEVTDPNAAVRLREGGERVIHRFEGAVVLEGAPQDPGLSAMVRPSREPEFELPATLDPARIGLLAFQLRQTEAYQARKARRPDVGVDIDEIISAEPGV